MKNKPYQKIYPVSMTRLLMDCNPKPHNPVEKRFGCPPGKKVALYDLTGDLSGEIDWMLRNWFNGAF